MAPAVLVHDAILLVCSHSTGSENMRGRKCINGTELFEYIIGAAFKNDLSTGFGHKAKPFQCLLVQIGMDLSDRKSVVVCPVGQGHVRILMWKALSQCGNGQNSSESVSHVLLVGRTPSIDHAVCVCNGTDKIAFGHGGAETASSDYAGDCVGSVIIPRHPVHRQASVTPQILRVERGGCG